ncbi:MAG: phosphotransferase [Solirubrobacteraceae bacterium]
MAEAPLAAIRCARALGLDPARLHSLGGKSGSTWGIGDTVLRVGPRVDEESLALSAAASTVPVPRVLARVDLEEYGGLLLERLPGAPQPSWRSLTLDAPGGQGWPAALFTRSWPRSRRRPAFRRVGRSAVDLGPRLLHLFNVLVDDAGNVTGVIDWANAGAGDPVRDQARSWSILTLDPSAARRSDSGWTALVKGWTAAGGLARIPDPARAAHPDEIE